MGSYFALFEILSVISAALHCSNYFLYGLFGYGHQVLQASRKGLTRSSRQIFQISSTTNFSWHIGGLTGVYPMTDASV